MILFCVLLQRKPGCSRTPTVITTWSGHCALCWPLRLPWYSKCEFYNLVFLLSDVTGQAFLNKRCTVPGTCYSYTLSYWHQYNPCIAPYLLTGTFQGTIFVWVRLLLLQIQNTLKRNVRQDGSTHWFCLLLSNSSSSALFVGGLCPQPYSYLGVKITTAVPGSSIICREKKGVIAPPLPHLCEVRGNLSQKHLPYNTSPCLTCHSFVTCLYTNQSMAKK